MSRENVEIVRRANDAFNRGDLRAVAADFALSFEYAASGVIPGRRGVYRGPQEYVQFLERVWGEFDDLRSEINEVIEAGDRVLVSLTVRGRGKQSGAATSRSFWQVWRVRDGKVTSAQGFRRRDEALEAVGQRE